MSKSRQVAFMPGHGIGPEVAWAARRCVDAVVPRFTWLDVAWGKPGRPADSGHQAAAKAIRATGRVLRGPLESPPGGGANPALALRDWLEIFASVRPCRSRSGVPGAVPGLNVLVIKEEPAAGAVLEREPGDDQWETLRPGIPADSAGASVWVFQPERTRRFFEFAFRRAADSGRRRVTIAHRASRHRATEGKRLRIAADVARGFPELEWEDQLADHVALQLARSPERFDVIVAGSLYGDLLADEAVGLAGGLTEVPEIQIGASGAAFTTVHGTAPKYAGLNRANPRAMLLAAAELVRDVGDATGAALIEEGVAEAARGGVDAGGAGTLEIADFVVKWAVRGQNRARSTSAKSPH